MNFNYRAPPTVAAFMKSDAHMRVIKGPQGCLSADTEFLTPLGWRRMDAWTPGTPVLECSLPSGRTQWREPLEYHVLPCESFIHFRNEHSLSMVLSDEHVVPHWDWRGRLKTTAAAKLAARPSRSTIPVHFAAPGVGLQMTPATLRLVVAQHADGHIDSSGATIMSLRKERKKARLRALLDAAGVNFTERVHAQRPDETVFRFRWWYKGKQFTPDFYHADWHQLHEIVLELEHWDGLHGTDERVYYSRHRSDADFVQFAAHATGLRATISTVAPPAHAPHWSPNYAVHIARLESPKNRVSIRKDSTAIERVPSADGRKYCFTTSTGFFVARHAGRVFVTGNSGKSSGSCVELLRRSISRPQDSDGIRRARFVVVRNTMPMLKETTIPTFLQWFPHGSLGSWHSTDKMYNFRFGDVDSQVNFRALDDQDDVAKLLSAEYTGCYFNEFREIDPVIHEAMTKRVGRWFTDQTWSKAQRDEAWYGIWADTNPPQVDSWHYNMMEKVIDNDWDVYHQPSGRSGEAENTDNLRSDYYDAKGLSEEYVRVMIDGEYGYDQSGQPVFGKLFVPAWHVSKEPLKLVMNSQYPLLIGLDAGLKPAAVVGQMDYLGRLAIVGECYVPRGESMGMERFLTSMLNPFLRTHFPNHKPILVVDPAAMHRGQAQEITPFQIIARHHVVYTAPTNDVAMRVGAGETWLAKQVGGGKPGLHFDPRTPYLQKALAHGYQFEKRKATAAAGFGSVDTKPLPDKNRHESNIADAFTYLCSYALGPQASAGFGGSQARPVEVVSSRGWT